MESAPGALATAIFLTAAAKSSAVRGSTVHVVGRRDVSMTLEDGQPGRQDGSIDIGVAVVSNMFVFLNERAENTMNALWAFVISSPRGGNPR
eukprot:5876989-Heterocapsa_arctica.AAC.1